LKQVFLEFKPLAIGFDQPLDVWIINYVHKTTKNMSITTDLLPFVEAVSLTSAARNHTQQTVFKEFAR
jgi:hypothetical protein